MKQQPDPEDDLRPEYDFQTLDVVAHGPGRKRPGEATLPLNPDGAEVFVPGPRPFGLCAGEFTLTEEFDEPLDEDIISDFEGR